MFVDFGQKPLPLGSGATVVEQVVRAILMGLTDSLAWPVVMRDDFTQGNVVLLHQVSGQLGCALNGRRSAVALIFTHFNPDGVAVARPTEICVLTLLVGRQVLYCTVLVHCKMPDKVTYAVVVTRLAGAQFAILESFRVTQSVRTTRKVLRAVNGNVAGCHASAVLAGVTAPWNVILNDTCLTVEGARTFGSCQRHKLR